MNRDFYLDLAASGLRMPIGTDLILHEEPDPESILMEGPRLGRVLERAASRYRTPLAIPLMDLKLEKADLLHILGVPEPQADTFHFDSAPGEVELACVAGASDAPFTQRNRAHIESIHYIAEKTRLLPVGMAIGPFSLMTKLLADPITPVTLAGIGVTPAEDGAVLAAERCLRLAEHAVSRSVRAQIRAGARVLLVCEPAANIVYISPRQFEAGAHTFERFVIQPNLRLTRTLAESGVDLFFHDCGELIPEMVRQFAVRLDPAILSLGGSRRLWEDAALVPKRVVLYGNLPTKSFYSDAAMPVEKVRQLARELVAKMHEVGHPHILGSECDVLHVADSADTIRRKVEEMLS